MSAINDGGPAFPSEQLASTIGMVVKHPGLSLRDYFAAQALAGLCASDEYKDLSFERAAKYAYEQADAMLAARSAPR